MQESPKEITWQPAPPVFQQCLLSVQFLSRGDRLPKVRSTCKLVQKVSGATGSICQVSLCPSDHPGSGRKGDKPPLVLEYSQMERAETHQQVSLKYVGAGAEARRTTELQPHDLFPIFPLEVGVNEEEVSHCLLSGPPQGDRVGGVQFWLHRSWGKQASKQSSSHHYSCSHLQHSRAGSVRDTCSANVTKKVPDRALRMGFMDHGCESQVQEHICSM